MRLSEEPSKPSRVLHLRGLPADTTEAEITQLTTLFGIATNIILTRQKNQVIIIPDYLSSLLLSGLPAITPAIKQLISFSTSSSTDFR